MTKVCPICLGQIIEENNEDTVRDDVTQQIYHKDCYEIIMDIIG